MIKDPGETAKNSRIAKISGRAGRRYYSWLVFFVAPSLIMILTSFRFPGEFGGWPPLPRLREASESEYGLTAEAYQFFFSDVVLCRNFPQVFWCCGSHHLICLIMAYPLAVLIARSEKRFRNLLVLLVVLPFASNFLIRIYAWMIILGPGIGAQPFHQCYSRAHSAWRR